MNFESVYQLILSLVTMVISTIITVAIDYTAITKKIQKKVLVIGNISTVLACINFALGGKYSVVCTSGVIASVIYIANSLYKNSESNTVEPHGVGEDKGGSNDADL